MTEMYRLLVKTTLVSGVVLAGLTAGLAVWIATPSLLPVTAAAAAAAFFARHKLKPVEA